MPRKILTILGTRPEIIRLSCIMPLLDAVADHRVLHTGQNYDPLLNAIFFQDLDLRPPDHVLDARGSIGQQLATMFQGVEQYLTEFDPDAVLVLGDTNSALTAIVCERLGYPVFHMEAGNRCYDDRVPEEKNRRIIDHACAINLPYTLISRDNLLREGLPNHRVLPTGNPIRQVLAHYQPKIAESNVLDRLGLTAGQYTLATAHRAENVDDPGTLASIMTALASMSEDRVVVFSCHPRTRQKLNKIQFAFDSSRLLIQDPFNFSDFACLEQHSALAVTDSGTVQEEMCLFGIPTLTIRHTTERPETVWCGSNILTGTDTDRILTAYQSIGQPNWSIPEGYDRSNVSNTVCNILMGNHV